MKSDAIIGAVEGVTKKWTKQRKAEERHAWQVANRRARLARYYRVTIKDVALDCMKEAYLKASANGSLPAHARQIFYQARPIIQAKTGEQLKAQYFCQTLLPDYLAETGVDWDVVFDDRGHFEEPHTEKVIGLGTLSVREYLRGVHGPRFTDLEVAVPKLKTQGPACRFGAVLFIEKEGFMPLFRKSKLAERYDLSIMSTKGMSNTAARELVDDLCGQHEIPLLVLHDFDKAGFSILGTLNRNTHRYYFNHHLDVIDLGLRLADVNELGLEPEEAFDRGDERSRRDNLRLNGADQEEAEFLLDQRVELNALPSDQLIEWIESKLDQNGITKVVPDEDFLTEAYRNSVAAQYAEDHVRELLEQAEKHAAEADAPKDLKAQVEGQLKEDPALSWHDAVARIVADADSE